MVFCFRANEIEQLQLLFCTVCDFIMLVRQKKTFLLIKNNFSKIKSLNLVFQLFFFLKTRKSLSSIGRARNKKVERCNVLISSIFCRLTFNCKVDCFATNKPLLRNNQIDLLIGSSGFTAFEKTLGRKRKI